MIQIDPTNNVIGAAFLAGILVAVKYAPKLLKLSNGKTSPQSMGTAKPVTEELCEARRANTDTRLENIEGELVKGQQQFRDIGGDVKKISDTVIRIEERQKSG